MPVVTVHMADENNTVEQKKALIHDITEAFVKNLGKPADAVTIMLNEVPLENIGKGYKTLKDIRG